VHKLYAVLLGGSGGPGRLSEDHETVFVVAEDDQAAKNVARTKWSGHGRGHIDALEVIDVVDGYTVILEPTEDTGQQYFHSFNDDPHDD
jgi:Domain of Unknown Function (DUF1543)